MSGWASQNGPEAIGWVREQADSPLKDKAIEGLATGMGRTDPVGATKFMLNLTPSSARTAAANTIFWQVMYKNGIESAIQWYDALPPAEMEIRANIFPGLKARQTFRQNEEANQWVNERAQELEEQTGQTGRRNGEEMMNPP